MVHVTRDSKFRIFVALLWKITLPYLLINAFALPHCGSVDFTSECRRVVDAKEEESAAAVCVRYDEIFDILRPTNQPVSTTQAVKLLAVCWWRQSTHSNDSHNKKESITLIRPNFGSLNNHTFFYHEHTTEWTIVFRTSSRDAWTRFPITTHHRF